MDCWCRRLRLNSSKQLPPAAHSPRSHRRTIAQVVAHPAGKAIMPRWNKKHPTPSLATRAQKPPAPAAYLRRFALQIDVLSERDGLAIASLDGVASEKKKPLLRRMAFDIETVFTSPWPGENACPPGTSA